MIKYKAVSVRGLRVLRGDARCSLYDDGLRVAQLQPCPSGPLGVCCDKRCHIKQNKRQQTDTKSSRIPRPLTCRHTGDSGALQVPLQPCNRFGILVRCTLLCPLDKTNRLQRFVGQKKLLLLSGGYAAEERPQREGRRQRGYNLQRGAGAG